MQRRVESNFHSRILLSLIILGLFSALIILPHQFISNAGNEPKSAGHLNPQTLSHEQGVENYDIRADKSAFDKIEQFRRQTNNSAASIADFRAKFVRGEEILRTKIPTLKVEYNTDIRTPEVIASDVKQGRNFLTSPTNASRVEILRDFVKENENLIGVSNEQASSLKVLADYTNPDGNLSFTHLEQRIKGIPVFRGEVKAGFTKNGEMIRVINNLAPALDYESLSSDFGDPLAAVKAAAGHINYELKAADVTRNNSASTDVKAVFGNGDWATTAEKLYFPTEPGVARSAWRVLIWEPVNAYYVIIDAEKGTMLWRKNITEDQTQTATYQIYDNANAMIKTADSPAPLTPGPIDTGGTQGPIIPMRSNVTRVGNEAPYTFNNNGWITDSANGVNGHTDGNAVEAGIDRDGTNGVDAVVPGVNRNFNSTWNPPPGNPAPGDNPLTPEAQKGAVIQMFYVMNLYHDELYRLGLTEQAFNFQHNNFGRGGLGNDRVSAEGQDSSGSNNANFGTPADGSRGRMQMYIWTGPTPDYDGTTDVDIIIHEVTHGTSNRLHGNAAGLSSNMSRGMGEGWGDFYGHAMTSEPTDPINGIYTTGGYATYLGALGFTSNYYYGIRRFPKAVMAFRGGPGNRPHNPLTFADADSTQINTTDGAFPRGAFGSSTADQVHNLGEIWSSALWEVRAKYVARLGWETGNRRVLQFVTDAMKMSPLGPTFLQERDAIIAAALASSPGSASAEDVADTWAGFAIRGMGASAKITVPGTGTGDTRVIEAFDLPNLLQTPTFVVSDAGGDNDGFPEPGEQLTLSLPLTNVTGRDATATTLQIVGGDSASYGTIGHSATVSRNLAFTVPVNTTCGSAITLTFNVNSSLGATSFTRSITIGVPTSTFNENFDGITAPALPANWTAAVVQNGINFVTTTTNPDTGPNSAFALDPLTVGGGTDLTSSVFPIAVSAATISFRNRYDTEPGWDGGVLEISIGGAAFQDIIAAGGVFIENGYNSVLGSNGVNNPLASRNAWSGNSGGYLTTIVRLPAAAAGQNVRFKWRFGADDNTAANGWNIDTVKVVGDYGCSVTSTVRAPFDFDGDRKSDISIFRPGQGEWWYLKSSTGGNAAFQFGLSTDKIVPADFTGDGKTDIAFWRESSGEWFILRSEDSSFYSFPFGTGSDIPVPGDFDGDGKADPAIFRPSNATWYILNSGGGTTIQSFGATGDRPVVGDYNGDNKADLAIFRPTLGQWWINSSATQTTTVASFGTGTDKTVQADYTGDGKTDIAFFRPSSSEWFILRSENSSFYSFPFGINGDIPAPGDYDGDGKADPTVFRPSSNVWYKLQSLNGFEAITFGIANDLPAPNAFVR